jgi:transcriptional regulator with XRE-family HTH domain
MSAMSQLIDLLRTAIDNKQVTVASLAAHADCSRQAIYDILNGTHEPKIGFVEKLLECLNAEITIKTRKRQKKLAS